MDVIRIIIDMFETKQTDMLSFEADIGLLRRLVPNIFREGHVTDFRRTKFRG